MTDFAFKSIPELAQLLRQGETSPVELAEYFLERLETKGRELNAVVTVTRERALEEAKIAERELRAGQDRGLLHGIPYGVKDLLATRPPIPTSWGAAPLRHQQFSFDAAVIEKLRQAGAVLVGKLAMIELGGICGFEALGATFTGMPLNPHNLAAWTGDSSSGPAAAVAAGCVPFAIGSETYGSIVQPAAYCGVVGLRPTHGSVSRYGAMEVSRSFDRLGPIALTAEDCGLVLAAISGGDERDPDTLVTLHTAKENNQVLRIGVVRPGQHCQDEIKKNFELALASLAKVATLEDIQLPDWPFDKALGPILAGESAFAFAPLLENGTIAQLSAPDARDGAYLKKNILAKDYLAACRQREQLQRAWQEFSRPYDALVSVTSSYVAPPITAHFSDYFTHGDHEPLTTIGTLFGLPALTVPVGLGERGLPTALQLLGAWHQEASLIQLATSCVRMLES
jgi:aspartyl-tRNA(Asn)/glutamyl-tRNA(Gln) amidotransferase subunit A